MPKVVANSVRVGNVIEHQGKLWRVVKMTHTMPGKGGAFQQMELKELREGTKLNERFRGQENVEVVRLDQTDYQFLYEDGDMIVLMHPETFEQINVPATEMGEEKAYLTEGMIVQVETYEEQLIGIALPDQVKATVAETEAVVKGQTAASSNKPAVLKNGIRVMVPPFIEAGDEIIVKTYEGEYLERAKG